MHNRIISGVIYIFTGKRMKELQNILAQMREIDSSGAKAVLATVVDVKGSSYRLPGAKMLILETGETFGTVSGGCLEADVLERAKRVLQTGAAQVFTYDTTANDDSVFSLNMGCRGVIRILLETIDRQSILIRALQTAFENQERQTIATLISTDSSLDIPIGGRFFYSEVEQFDFKNLPKFLESSCRLLNDCKIFFDENCISQIKTYETGQGSFEFFFENIKPPVSLVVFGAGADAVPLISFAKGLGWRASIVDHRPAIATGERFPKADEIVISRPENLNENLFVSAQTVAVLMTHDYSKDKEILRRILPLNPVYVGVLGPKRRTETMLQELADESEKFSEEQLQKLYAPVGLDIGADTPEAIALSIIAEINAVLANRAGGFLRNRTGSIYERS